MNVERMNVEQQISYCTTADGVRIAYATYGNDGAPPLVHLPDVPGQEAIWASPWGRAFLEALARCRRLITLDVRGRGSSERDVDCSRPELLLADIGAVADNLQLDGFELFAERPAHCALAIMYAAAHPAQVSRLILFSPMAASSAVVVATAESARASFAIFARSHATILFPSGPPEVQRWFSTGARAWSSGEIVAETLSWTYDLATTLPGVTSPTLIIHRNASQICGAAQVRRVASLIPKARLVTLEGDVGDAHWEYEQYIDILYDFLGVEGKSRVELSLSGTAVILFTDIVDSTAQTERLGDARFREASRALEAGLRSAIAEAGGAAIDRSLGDGVLATFGSAAQAIEGARRCLALSAASELGLHIGLHAGDVIREEGNVFGGAVNIASRICGLSAPGEILVSDVVRGMARSSAGVVFEDRGEQEMKGVGEPVRVYAVREGGMSIEPAIHYCTTTDGVSIAWGEAGEGPALLHFQSTPFSHVQEAYALGGEGYRGLARSFRLIMFDARGTGLSERDVEEVSGATLLADAEAVVAAAKLDRFVVVTDMGSLALSTALQLAIALPHQITHVICTDPVQSMSELEGTPYGRVGPGLAEADWDVYVQTTFRILGGFDQAEGTWVDPYAKAAAKWVDPSVGLRYTRLSHAMDVRDLLAGISQPTLVLKSEQTIVPSRVCQRFAAAIPGAQFQEYTDTNFERWPELIRAFVGQAAPPRGLATPTASGTAVILFTDIADSTPLTERLGDAQFRELSRALDVGLRAAIREAGGEAVEGKLLGDGVLATFPSAAQAIDGARRCLALSAASELGLHIGLHAGDVIREEVDGRRDVFGGAVNIASRICGLSAPGEILVSDVVRGMARSSAGVVFEDRGEQEMKGVGEPVRVYAVRMGGD